MSKKNWSNILTVLARTALALVFVQTAWAGQDQNAKDKSPSKEQSKSQQAPSLPAGEAEKAQLAKEEHATEANYRAQEYSQRGGQHEGITVHGHWSIEVHNPDGSLVRHVEFENSLDPGFVIHIPSPPAPQPLTLQVPGGATYLAALLAGQIPIQAPVWSILLVGPSGLNNLLNATNAPCNQSSSLSNSVAFGACEINMPSSPFCSGAAPNSGCNLSVSTLGTLPALTGIQLSGSVTATQNGLISTVATLVHVASFTSSSNFQGAPIAVSVGQTIAVTVTISFS